LSQVFVENPQLVQFKRPQASIDKIMKGLKKNSDRNSSAGMINMGYKNKSGTTFGLY